MLVYWDSYREIPCLWEFLVYGMNKDIEPDLRTSPLWIDSLCWGKAFAIERLSVIEIPMLGRTSFIAASFRTYFA